MKKILALLMLALVLFSLSAKNVQWNFNAFPENCEISYNIDNGDEWKKLPSNKKVIENLNGRNPHVLSYTTSLSGDKIFNSTWKPVLNNELSFFVSPYALNWFTYKNDNILSKYSFILGTSYQYRLDNGFGYGFETLFSIADLEKEKGIYSNFKLGAVASYKHFVNNNNQFVKASLIAGADTVFFASNPEAFFYIATVGEYGWLINYKVAITTALRSDMSFISGGSFGFEFSPIVNLVCYF